MQGDEIHRKMPLRRLYVSDWQESFAMRYNPARDGLRFITSIVAHLYLDEITFDVPDDLSPR